MAPLRLLHSSTFSSACRADLGLLGHGRDAASQGPFSACLLALTGRVNYRNVRALVASSRPRSLFLHTGRPDKAAPPQIKRGL